MMPRCVWCSVKVVGMRSMLCVGILVTTKPEITITQVLEHYDADLSRVREHGWCPVKCPFHDDSHASGSVNLALNGFKCHTCDVSGDAWSLIMKVETLDFRGACDWARRALGAVSGDVQPATKARYKPSFVD